MKYFINEEEIKFGDKFFHVKEGNLGGIVSTTTLEGKLTKDNVKYLIALDVVKAVPEEEDVKNLAEDLDKNIELLEKICETFERLIG